ncbi:type 4 pilus major pilin [Asaia spathodeae]|uniref:Type 4 secretion system PilS N-terminal domain-containing protein n=1 Tax=Asaia spathodeae TaxID=657016 RepID=A0ABX2P9F1_9PROT|nr:type 4 pilus major pilin [Asaia spathodeae]GBR16853.1 hypothetical protein AA105894_1675 [Asaia spathodeae NBRC 105894]
MGSSQTLGWIITGIISVLAIVAIAFGYGMWSASDRLNSATHQTSVIAADIRQFYEGSGATDFSDLTTATAIKAGGSDFVATGATTIPLPWTGSYITYSGATDQFFGTAVNVAARSCAAYARSQKTAVTVNGQQYSTANTSGIASACHTSDDNTIVFAYNK